MVGQDYRFNGHEFEQAPEVGVGQRSLTCCSPWGHKESDTTEQLNPKISELENMPAFPGKETLSLEGGGPRFGRAGEGNGF